MQLFQDMREKYVAIEKAISKALKKDSCSKEKLHKKICDKFGEFAVCDLEVVLSSMSDRKLISLKNHKYHRQKDGANLTEASFKAAYGDRVQESNDRVIIPVNDCDLQKIKNNERGCFFGGETLPSGFRLPKTEPSEGWMAREGILVRRPLQKKAKHKKYPG